MVRPRFPRGYPRRTLRVARTPAATEPGASCPRLQTGYGTRLTDAVPEQRQDEAVGRGHGMMYAT